MVDGYAHYRKAELPVYDGNPLIEALPGVDSKEEIIRKMMLNASWEKINQYPAPVRIMMLDTIDFYFPVPESIQLKQNIDRLIRQTYVYRNPFGEMVNIPGGNSMSVIGISGMGKSVTIDRVLSTYKQVIHHYEYDGKPFLFTQVVYLKLICPVDGSLKGLLLQFYSKIDDLVGSSYYKRFITTRATLDVLLNSSYEVAKSIGLGLIIIDEINFLTQAKGNNKNALLDFLVHLNNVLGISVIFVGTPTAFEIIGSDMRQARRSSGTVSDIVWERYENNDVWRMLSSGFWEYQITDIHVDISDEIINTLYYESQGITDILKKLHIKSQVFALSNGFEQVNSEIIEVVADRELSVMKPVIDTLKSGNLKRLFVYKDVYIPQIYSKKDSDVDVKQLLKPDSLDKDDITHGICKRKRTTRKAVSPHIDSDIRVIASKRDEDDRSVYDKLKAAGIIKAGIE